MRNIVTQFLILALLSSNSYAGPLVDRNRPDIRPDIRPGQRGSIAQEAMGSPHNQFSLLNPGSNQSVLMLNNILLLQQYGNNANTESYMTFNPQSSLPSSGIIAPLDAMAKLLLDTNGGNALTNRVAPSPFASKVAKSQTQGAIFVSSANSFSASKDTVTSESYMAGLGFAVGAIVKFEQHKDNPTQVPIGTPIGLVFVAAAMLFLPSILDVAGGGTVVKPTSDDVSSQSLDPFKSPAFVSTKAELSNQMVASGVALQEAQKISQALITMWTIAISSGVRDVPSNTRNEITTFFKESCSSCTPQMIGTAMTKSEQLVESNLELRLNKSQLNEVAAKINSAMKRANQVGPDALGGDGSKQTFIKTLQGKTITIDVTETNPTATVGINAIKPLVTPSEVGEVYYKKTSLGDGLMALKDKKNNYDLGSPLLPPLPPIPPAVKPPAAF